MRREQKGLHSGSSLSFSRPLVVQSLADFTGCYYSGSATTEVNFGLKLPTMEALSRTGLRLFQPVRLKFAFVSSLRFSLADLLPFDLLPSGFCSAGVSSFYTAMVISLLVDLGVQVRCVHFLDRHSLGLEGHLLTALFFTPLSVQFYAFFLTWRYSAFLTQYMKVSSPNMGESRADGREISLERTLLILPPLFPPQDSTPRTWIKFSTYRSRYLATPLSRSQPKVSSSFVARPTLDFSTLTRLSPLL